MKKIYINNSNHAHVFGSTMLLPGSNAVEEIDNKKFPQFVRLLDEGEIEESDNAEKAVAKANTQKAVEDIVKTAPKNEKVKVAARKRNAQLDEIDEQVKKARAEVEKKDGE